MSMAFFVAPSPHPVQDTILPPSCVWHAVAKYVRFVPLLCSVYSLAWEGFHIFFLQTYARDGTCLLIGLVPRLSPRANEKRKAGRGLGTRLPSYTTPAPRPEVLKHPSSAVIVFTKDNRGILYPLGDTSLDI